MAASEVKALQAVFGAWLVHYNTRRPHLSYRNRGKRSLDAVKAFLSFRDEDL